MPEKSWYRLPSRIIVAGVSVALLIALSELAEELADTVSAGTRA